MKRKGVARAARSLLVLALSYLAASFVLANLRYGDFTVAQILTQDVFDPLGYSERRFREAAENGPVDVVFIGSSHAYRSFDPRLFAAAGLTSFNLGSTEQTPINSYYLLRRYLGHLRPRLVVFEAYFEVLDKDGVESFFDLNASLPLSRELVEMALATRHPHTINALVASRLSLTGRSREGRHRGRGTYVPGGYVESTGVLDDGRFPPPHEIHPLERQMVYLERCLRLVKASNAAVVLVVQPLPPETLARMTNEAEVSQRLAAMAARIGVPYHDFNGRLELDTAHDFMDTHHLNAAGVAVFNRALHAVLVQDRLLPLASAPGN